MYRPCAPRASQEARNVKDIADTIEEERAKVVAKTPVTEAVSARERAAAGLLAVARQCRVQHLHLPPAAVLQPGPGPRGSRHAQGLVPSAQDATTP